MLILIEKDSATRVPKECSVEDAQSYVDQGFPVHVVQADGRTTALEEFTAGQPQDDRAVEDPPVVAAPAKAKRKLAA